MQNTKNTKNTKNTLKAINLQFNQVAILELNPANTSQSNLLFARHSESHATRNGVHLADLLANPDTIPPLFLIHYRAGEAMGIRGDHSLGLNYVHAYTSIIAAEVIALAEDRRLAGASGHFEICQILQTDYTATIPCIMINHSRPLCA